MPDASPFYDLAETSSAEENLDWRIRLREAAIRDPDLQAVIRQACEEDVLFFFTFALWLIEPRGDKPELPFLLWPHQIEAILAIEKAIHDSRISMEELIDVLIDKSRAQGASYICLGVLLKHYLFDKMFSASLISRNMDCVDNARDPDSLFYKLDFLVDHLPFWLRPSGSSPPSKDKRQRLINEHSWTNPELYGTMVGYAAGGDVGSGGRKGASLFDEVAKFDDQRPGMAQEAMDSTAYTTNVRLLVSTHKGDTGVYYDMVFGHEWVAISKTFPWGGSGVFSNGAGGIKIVLDWRDNPSHNRLAYRHVNGDFKAERPEEAEAVQQYVTELRRSGNWAKLLRKGFVKEGRMRSRWYDNRCLQQGATPRSIAQEVDRDPRGTVGKMFPSIVLDEMAKNHVKPPLWQGDAIVRDGNLYLVEQQDGPLKLWFRPGVNDQAPEGRYALAVDPGTGIESSDAGNSTICGGNAVTGEQVLEFSKQVPEARLADLAVALAEWLNEALLIWEAQGPCGKRFMTRVVVEIGYWNIWKRPTVELRGKPRSKINTEQLGWVNNRPADKRDLFEDLWLAMQDEKFTPRSAEMIAECRGWEEVPSKTENGKVDVKYKGTGHGDRAIAAGLCHKALKERAESLDKDAESGDTSENAWSMGGRLARRQSDAKEKESDDFAGFRPEFDPDIAGSRWWHD
jgi:hypothetical protein